MQNQLEAKLKREAKKSEVVEELCSNDNCKKPYIKTKSNHYYCSTDCRKEVNFRDAEARRMIEVANYNLTKDEARLTNGSKKAIKLPEKFLVRGNDSTQSTRKEKAKRENKRFSAKWLEKLWNKRKVS